jgi:hypothetical protein
LGNRPREYCESRKSKSKTAFDEAVKLLWGGDDRLTGSCSAIAVVPLQKVRTKAAEFTDNFILSGADISVSNRINAMVLSSCLGMRSHDTTLNAAVRIR